MTTRATRLARIVVLLGLGAFSFAIGRAYLIREVTSPFATSAQKPSEFCAAMEANVSVARELPPVSQYMAESPYRALLETWKRDFLETNGLDESQFESDIRVFSVQRHNALNGEYFGEKIAFVVMRDWYVVVGATYVVADEYVTAHPEATDQFLEIRAVFDAPTTTPLTCEEAVTKLAIPDDGTIFLQVLSDDVGLHGEGKRCMGSFHPSAYVIVSLISGEEVVRTTLGGECSQLLD